MVQLMPLPMPSMRHPSARRQPSGLSELGQSDRHPGGTDVAEVGVEAEDLLRGRSRGCRRTARCGPCSPGGPRSGRWRRPSNRGPRRASPGADGELQPGHQQLLGLGHHVVDVAGAQAAVLGRSEVDAALERVAPRFADRAGRAPSPPRRNRGSGRRSSP